MFALKRLPGHRGRFKCRNRREAYPRLPPRATDQLPLAEVAPASHQGRAGVSAAAVGGAGGSSEQILELRNLPDHDHNLRAPGGQPFNAVRLDSAVIPGISPGPGFGPTAPGQAQYLNNSGGIRTTADLNEPFGLMNPYLTINYIIRSGPPRF